MEFKDRTSRLLEEFAGRLRRAADLLGPVREDEEQAAAAGTRPRVKATRTRSAIEPAKKRRGRSPRQQQSASTVASGSEPAKPSAASDAQPAVAEVPPLGTQVGAQVAAGSLRWEPIDGGQSALSACHSDGDHFEHVVRNRRGSWILSGSAEIYPEGSIEFPGMFAAKAEAQSREDKLVADLRKINNQRRDDDVTQL